MPLPRLPHPKEEEGEMGAPPPLGGGLGSPPENEGGGGTHALPPDPLPPPPPQPTNLVPLPLPSSIQRKRWRKGEGGKGEGKRYHSQPPRIASIPLMRSLARCHRHQKSYRGSREDQESPNHQQLRLAPNVVSITHLPFNMILYFMHWRGTPKKPLAWVICPMPPERGGVGFGRRRRRSDPNIRGLLPKEEKEGGFPLRNHGKKDWEGVRVGR